jgi:phage tail-like protein
MPPARKHDPLRNYTFRIKWDNGYISHVTLAGPLIRSITPVEYRDGGDPENVHTEPGRVTWPPVILQRPRTSDTAFEQWASPGGSGGLTPSRKTVTIEVYTARGKLALRYLVHRCWPQAYEALPALGHSPRLHVLETLTLAHEGWERDTSVTFPG